MNILITEIYQDEHPVTWICNFESVRPELQRILRDALESEDNCAAGEYDVGFQHRYVDSIRRVKTPCMVDDSVTLYMD